MDPEEINEEINKAVGFTLLIERMEANFRNSMVRVVNRAIDGQIFQRPPQELKDSPLAVVRSQPGLVDAHAGFPSPIKDPFDLGSRRVVTDPIKFRELRVQELVKEREYLQELLDLVKGIQSIRSRYNIQLALVGSLPHGLDILTGSQVERRNLEDEIKGVSRTIRDFNLELEELRKRE